MVLGRVGVFISMCSKRHSFIATDRSNILQQLTRYAISLTLGKVCELSKLDIFAVDRRL